MDQKMQYRLRPRWIELLKIRTTSDLDTIARRFFTGSDGSLANHTTFVAKLGVDLKPFTGYYMEIGGTDTPIAPVTAGRISPILALQMSHHGRYKPMRHSLNGLYSQDKLRAWIEVDDWEEHFGDTFFADLQKRAEKIDKKKK